MISLIESYSEIIASYEIQRYRQYGNAYEFIAKIQFKDGSELITRDYIFLTNERKYAFHWQDEQSHLIRRWDNSAHHQQISTFPFHVHTRKGIEESKPINLKKVLEYISSQTSEI